MQSRNKDVLRAQMAPGLNGPQQYLGGAPIVSKMPDCEFGADVE